MENTFEQITTQMNQIYQAKNKDYGNSFNSTLDDFGLVAGVVRLFDKINRIKTLCKGQKAEVKESLEDTFLDLANYSVMCLMWIRTHDLSSF